jgi:hypothetical protein
MKPISRLALFFFVGILILSGCSVTSHDGHSSSDGKDSHKHASTMTMPDNTKAIWTFSPEKPIAGGRTTISIQVLDEKGKPVTAFDEAHEKLMHLIVVSDDLSSFEHIHPTYQKDGRFDIAFTFPVGGGYRLYADYKPKGSEATSKSSQVTLAGTAPALQPIVPDGNLTRSVPGVSASLSHDPLVAGKPVSLTFRLHDASTNKPITDLQSYLGAVGHVVIISRDGEEYLHVHPLDERSKGPDAIFQTTFPKSGVYKMWGQFKRGGQLFVVPFVVNVP